jgi:hypothetical protein
VSGLKGVDRRGKERTSTRFWALLASNLPAISRFALLAALG